MEETPKTSGVKVMRKSPEDLARGAGTDAMSGSADETAISYFTTLSNGREVTLREMTAADLLFIEKGLANVGDMERSLKLCSRLSVGTGKITFDELQKLKMKDLRKVTDLLAKAGGSEDEDEDPNF
jgi:hypothetical protein